MQCNEKIYVITADIGYGILDPIRNTYPNRFINVGASEMLMVGIAIGLCYEGYIPICYTITTFLLYRPFEMIRNYVNYEKLNVKLVGCGRNKDYTHDGISHWADDDIQVVNNSFPNIKTYHPEIITKEIFNDFINETLPCYLNLRRVNI